MTVFEIPLTATPAIFNVTLAGGSYTLRTLYCAAPNGEGGWILDMADSDGNLVLCGAPLVTGADILAQYDYLGIGGKLYVVSDGDYSAVPTFGNLGTASHLYYEA